MLPEQIAEAEQPLSQTVESGGDVSLDDDDGDDDDDSDGWGGLDAASKVKSTSSYMYYSQIVSR